SSKNKITSKSTSSANSNKGITKSSSSSPTIKHIEKKNSPTVVKNENKKNSPSITKPITKNTTTKNSLSSPSTTKTKIISGQVSKNDSSNTTYKEGYIYNEWNMGLGIYEEPNENSNIAVMLRDSTVVKVLGTVNGFYKIEFNGNQIGYVNTGNVVFSEKLAGNPVPISQMAYIYDMWSTGPVEVFEYSGATTPEAVLAQGTKVGYLGNQGNVAIVAFGPNYDEIGVLNPYFVTFQKPTISSNTKTANTTAGSSEITVKEIN
ncbi:MAG: SH3 domain-containing protein, partial [Clostridium perfringens]|nr:SH3 domain-containing protein [Clostridium perfringens]